MKVSDYVIDFLVRERVTHIFEVCGGSITHLLNSLCGRKDITTVSMHHEQAASFAAEAYGRISGNFGIAMATSGPGATNLVTGIGSAFFDSTPCLFITGQVNTYEFKFDKPVRQAGFQETDIVDIVRPIVKEAYMVKDSQEIKYYLERAVYIARSGRPGPVLLDIPMNVQRADVEPKKLKSFKARSRVTCRIKKSTFDKIDDALQSSMRPVVLVGGGARTSMAQKELLKFIHKTGMPVVTSLMGLDSFPHDLPQYIGMIGTYGNRYANLTIANADLILALGTRFDTRQTGTRPDTFARGAAVIHVDIDPHEINNKVKSDYPICCDIKEFLSGLNRRIGKFDRSKAEQWRKRIENYKKSYPSYIKQDDNKIQPNFLMDELSGILPDDAIICVDVGQHQMWAAQSLKIKRNQRLITQGGMASMGSALSMAVGASSAKPKNIVVVITGDGGFQTNIQELQTVYHHRMPIKIIMLNNNGYGMIRQFQKQYFNSRFQSTDIGYSQPDFQKVVSSYGIPVMKLSKGVRVSSALRCLFSNMKPLFLEIEIDKNLLVTPKLAVNRPVEDQEPLLPRDELRTNMFIELLSGE